MNFRNINRPVVLLLVVLTISLVASGVFVGAAEEEQELHFGLVAHRVVNVWEALFANSFKWYCEDHGIKATVLEAKNDPSLQLTQIRRLVDMGADGIVVAAVESTAVIPAVEYAKEHGVPVVTANVDIYSPEVSIYVGFSGINASETLGKEIVNYLRDEVEPVGEVKGSILEVRGTIGSATGNDRHDGFAAVIEEYPDVEVFTVVGNWDRAEGKTKAQQVLRAHEIDAIYGGNGAMAMGAVGAAEALGQDPSEIFVATVDAMPAVLEAIGEGKVNVALDQPAAFYTPLAVHFLRVILDEGEGALPQPGDVLTMEDLDIVGEEHHGVDIWANDEMWAPAPVVASGHGHPWVQTKGILVTEENYQLESLWGNLELPGW